MHLPPNVSPKLALPSLSSNLPSPCLSFSQIHLSLSLSLSISISLLPPSLSLLMPLLICGVGYKKAGVIDRWEGGTQKGIQPMGFRMASSGNCQNLQWLVHQQVWHLFGWFFGTYMGIKTNSFPNPNFWGLSKLQQFWYLFGRFRSLKGVSNRALSACKNGRFAGSFSPLRHWTFIREKCLNLRWAKSCDSYRRIARKSYRCDSNC